VTNINRVAVTSRQIKSSEAVRSDIIILSVGYFCISHSFECFFFFFYYNKHDDGFCLKKIIMGVRARKERLETLIYNRRDDFVYFIRETSYFYE